MSEEEKKAAVKDFALTKGLLVALLAGIMSACFALGLDAGTPIKEAALEKEQMHCMQDSPSFSGNVRRILYQCSILHPAESEEPNRTRIFLCQQRYIYK